MPAPPDDGEHLVLVTDQRTQRKHAVRFTDHETALAWAKEQYRKARGTISWTIVQAVTPEEFSAGNDDAGAWLRD